MADPGRRVSFSGARPSSAASTRNNQVTFSDPLEDGQQPVPSRSSEQGQRLRSLNNLRRIQPDPLVAARPQQNKALLSPSFESNKTTGDAQVAAVRAMASFNSLREQAQSDGHTIRSPPLPSPGLQLPTQTLSATSLSAVGGAQKSGLARGLFKVSSLLNLRGGSSSSIKKSLDDGNRPATSAPSSPKDIPLSPLPWFDFGIGRRTNSRSSTGLVGFEPDKEPASDLELSQNLSSSQGKSSLQEYFYQSSSPLAADYTSAARKVGRTAKSHDWKQWDRNDDTGAYLAVNESDFVWHRPTLKQIVESLQVAIVSGETVPAIPNTKVSPPSTTPQASKPTTMSRMKRRPSSPLVPSPSTLGPEHPIPGRYRSYIMRAIEGIYDIQAAFDAANERVAEVEKAHDHVLQQFRELSRDWDAREQDLEAEVRSLREELLVARSSSSSSSSA